MEIIHFEHYIWRFASKNKKFMEEMQVAYENNPDNLHPTPRHREIIEKYAYPEHQEEYLDIAKKWELGEVSIYDEKAISVISFLMDWSSIWFSNYMLEYCYNNIKDINDWYKKLNPILPNNISTTKFLSECFVFSETEIADFINKWDAIQVAREEMLEQHKKRLQELDKMHADMEALLKVR